MNTQKKNRIRRKGNKIMLWYEWDIPCHHVGNPISLTPSPGCVRPLATACASYPDSRIYGQCKSPMQRLARSLRIGNHRKGGMCAWGG